MLNISVGSVTFRGWHKRRFIWAVLLLTSLVVCALWGLAGLLPVLGRDPIYIGGPSYYGHEEEIHYGAFLADGKTVALANPYHGLIYLVDSSSARFIRALATPNPEIRAVGATPDGELLALQVDNRLTFFDVLHSDKIVADLNLRSSIPGSLSFGTTPLFASAMAVSPEGRIAAVSANQRGDRVFNAADAGAVLLVDIKTHSLVRALDVPAQVGLGAFSPDGKRFAVLGRTRWALGLEPPGRTFLWELPSGNLLKSIAYNPAGEFGGGIKVRFSKDSEVLAIFHVGGQTSDGPKLDTWELYESRTGDLVRTVEQPPKYLSSKMAATAISRPPLPEFCEDFTGQTLPIDLLSRDGTRHVVSPCRGVFITNPTLPGEPTATLTFLTPRSYSPSDVAWFCYMTYPPRLFPSTFPAVTSPGSPFRPYAYWNGSAGGARLVTWHRMRDRDPSSLEIEHQRRPDLIKDYLNGAGPPVPTR